MNIDIVHLDNFIENNVFTLVVLWRMTILYFWMHNIDLLIIDWLNNEVHNLLAWGMAQALEMAAETSHACPAGSGVFYNVWIRGCAKL